VKALNSSPSNAKRKKEGRKEGNVSFYWFSSLPLWEDNKKFWILTSD
jgi:hypothetical protein